MVKRNALFILLVCGLVQLLSFSSFGQPSEDLNRLQLIEQISERLHLKPEAKNSLFYRIFHDSALTLEEWMASELGKRTADFPEDLKRKYSDKRFLFVDGIMNELASLPRNYFTDNIDQLKKLNLEYSHKGYSSGASIPDNAEVLNRDIRAKFKKHGKPLILIGHSMGGAEAIYAVLKYPDLLLDHRVEKVVSIQGAIGGSDLVGYPNAIGRGVEFFLGQSMDSLRPDIAKENFRVVFENFQAMMQQRFPKEEYQERFNDLSSRVFYVRGSHFPNGTKLSFGLRLVDLFFKKGKMLDSENDGLVSVDDQILALNPEFGVDLGVLNADHMELVVSGICSHSNRPTRKAFTRALLRSLDQNSDDLRKLSPPRPKWKIGRE